MYWSRVPIISATRAVRDGLISLRKAAANGCLWVLGYKWCCICNRKISPKEEMTYFVMHSLYGTHKIPMCLECDKLSQGGDLMPQKPIDPNKIA